MKSKRIAALVTTGVLTLTTALGLYSWWNTNLFGDDSFCNGKLTPSDLASALDTQGRISSVSSSGTTGLPEFRCTVERTSKFLGAEPMKVDVHTAVYAPDFAFQTRTWKSPATLSYLSGNVTGAVSADRGWVMLPTSCRDKAGFLGLGRRRLPAEHEVTVVEARLERGTAEPSKLADLLVKAAARVTESAGCSLGAGDTRPTLQGPGEEKQLDTASACGMQGFAVPADALIDGEVTPGAERVSGTASASWTCDLRFSGSAEAEVSFSTTSDPSIVNDVLRRTPGWKDLPQGQGEIDGYSRAILKCSGKDVYFGMRQDDTYTSVLLDEGKGRWTAVSQAMFQSFLDAAGKQYGCPAVKVPRS
ncbi:hypothetical protein QMZ92_31485 [Streptomyces sp. HNM0645]|uniref:hypothetical protein n=1 Tax=Streptomyces sp. HNM0645 TaxID=2782343 RepID=UPI0024B670B6|nr:hypothetical protein [Streptomyces sp. HNM0645]MDI9888752.1 hypothetical protein [Streptomyces sp. HNM0645]